MNDLNDVQLRMQSYLLHGDQNIFTHVDKPPVGSRKERLAIYKNGYLIRLIECLKADFSKLTAFMGEQRFESMIKKYLAANPSHFYSVNDVGTYLADFLEAQFPKRTILADIARLERMACISEDAADQPILTVAELAKVAQDDWPNLQFVLHASVQFVYLKTNALEICEVINQQLEAQPSTCTLDQDLNTAENNTVISYKLPRTKKLTEPQLCIFWRTGDYAQHYLPSRFETAILECLAHGLSFMDVCESLLAASIDAQTSEAELSERIIATLVTLINKGLLTEVK